jgi:hypothetical protein
VQVRLGILAPPLRPPLPVRAYIHPTTHTCSGRGAYVCLVVVWAGWLAAACHVAQSKGLAGLGHLI